MDKLEAARAPADGAAPAASGRCCRRKAARRSRRTAILTTFIGRKLQLTGVKPTFDSAQPFEVVADKPPFDPSKPNAFDQFDAKPRRRCGGSKGDRSLKRRRSQAR
jgi:hypothetical protein